MTFWDERWQIPARSGDEKFLNFCEKAFIDVFVDRRLAQVRLENLRAAARKFR